MFDRRKWNVAVQDPALVEMLARELSIHELCARLLINRGYTDAASARAFIEKSDSFLYNPYLLKDMDSAVGRITEAIEKEENITIYGDYDVDGVTSVSVLYRYLKERGASVDYYIPTRENEGYGLHISAFDAIHKKGTGLVITVDTGITALDEIAYATEIGLDVIVSDHHECRAELPKCVAVVNPRRIDCSYPFKNLAGVGVVFKLICALELRFVNYGEYNLYTIKDMCRRYIDLVMIGTVADVMPLYDENRIIVYMGLGLLSHTQNTGVRALFRAVGIDLKKPITASAISYTIAPRINAVGRLGNAARAVELFLATSPRAADIIAEELCLTNRERQQTENDIYEEALCQAEAIPESEKEHVLVLASDAWHPGVIGIVSSRITEKFGKPSILISFDPSDSGSNSVGKGSARSVRGVNMVEALTACEDLLLKYGGHELAAGLSIERGNLDAFRRRLNEFISTSSGNITLMQDVSVETEITEKDVSMNTVEEISKLEPYGAKNPEPVFVLREVKIEEIVPLSLGKHTRLILQRNDVEMNAVFFGHNLLAEGFSIGDKVDILCLVNINEFRGNRTVQLIIRDIDFSEHFYQGIADMEARFDNLQAESCEFDEIPDRQDFSAVYKYLRNSGFAAGKSTSIMKLTALFPELSYLKARIILEVFSECELLTYQKLEAFHYYITLRETTQKKDLFASPLMMRLHSLADRG